MYFKTKFFLILCAIPLIKAIGLKIDGLLNLGDTWSYEYRILRTDANDSPQFRTEENHKDQGKEVARETPPQIDMKAALIKEMEKVRTGEKGIAHDKEKETAVQKDEGIARDKEKAIAGQKDEEIARDKEKETAGQKDEEIARDKKKETAVLKDEEIVRDKEKETAGQKDEEIVRDKEKETAVQKDVEIARDKEKELARQRDEEIAHHKVKIARQKDEEYERIQRDEEHLSLAEQIFRKEADRLRKEAQSPKLRHGQNLGGQVHYIHNINKHKTVETTEARLSKWLRELKTETVGTTEARIPKQKIETVATTESATEDSSKSDDSDKPKKRTMTIFDDATDPKNMLRDVTDYSDTQYYSDSHDEESSYSSEISASFKDETRQGIERPETDTSTSSSESAMNIIKINNYTTPKDAIERINKTVQMMAVQRLVGKNTSGQKKKKRKTTKRKQKSTKRKQKTTQLNQQQTTTKQNQQQTTTKQNQQQKATIRNATVTKVTTVRTGEIFTNEHRVKDNPSIMEFTTHLYKQTLKLFTYIKEKSNQDHVKKEIDGLMKSYQEKFKEFLNKTVGQKIITRLGTQKVILNTIDMNNRLLKRLMNFMISGLDKKGVLRHNAGTANRFQKAIELEQKLQLFHACRKFGICRNGPGFSSFLTDVMDILLKYDDTKFKKSVDAFTETIKYIDFIYLKPETEKKLKLFVERIERENIMMLRAMLKILKNTITSKNKPMIVSHYKIRRSIVNSTLALLEVIDLLDTQIPRNNTNVLEWANMKKSLQDFGDDKRSDIQHIMATIIRNVSIYLRGLDDMGKKIVPKNLDTILFVVLRPAD